MSEILTPEVTHAPRPEFNAGSVVISHFSPSPEGFEIQTDESIRRKAPDVQLGLTAEQKLRLKAGMQREMQFNAVGEVRDARTALREARERGADAEEIAQLSSAYEEQRQRYTKGMVGKVGIREVRQEGNTLVVKPKFVSFPVYNEFSRPSDSPEILDLSAVVGEAMIVRTADGRIVIQHRAIEKQRLDEDKPTRGNASYTDIPGASVAGMVDPTLQSPDRLKGTPDPVTTESIKAGILKEAGEELGLGPEHLDKMRIVGVAHDKIKIHDEILLLADSNLTASQIRETSRTSKRNKNLGDIDFEEKFIDIPGTPKAIETLLTEVRCPLPPTHAAALVAAGYSLVLQEQGLEEANKWRTRLETGIRDNYREMDRMVATYYDKHPEALTQVPERFWGKNIPGRNPNGYTPAYGAGEQGLDEFDDAMVETGLMPETRRVVPEADLFDVDGVLTDPAEKRVPDEVLTTLISKLESGSPVGLNTGRSIAWLEERLIRPLLDRVTDKSILTNFVAIGEKGGTWLTFNADGEAHHGKAKGLPVLPADLKDRVQQLVQDQYADSMFYDASKETMVTIEMHDGYDRNEFHRRQEVLVEDLATILADYPETSSYRTDPTNIATDVESPYVGKALGADRFLQFLKDRNIKPQQFKTYGDSTSDMEMADELERRKKQVEMVYVGDRQKLGEPSKDYPVTYVPGFVQGTLSYLNG